MDVSVQICRLKEFTGRSVVDLQLQKFLARHKHEFLQNNKKTSFFRNEPPV